MKEYPKLILRGIDNLNDINVYIKEDGFVQAKKALKLNHNEIIDIVKTSGLRGRGGACFPTGLKWSFMPKDDAIKYLAVNLDESEPGSFKDRQIIEQNPFQLIEGIIISSYAMKIPKAYIYIRGEYHKWAELLRDAINTAYRHNYIGDNMKEIYGVDYKLDIVVHEGAGAYICGEETSLMNSIEGIRAYPRLKPPFPAQQGLWGKPTTINNAETIATVPAIFRIGADAYAKIGNAGHCGTLLFGVSGHVNKPGVYELPTNITLKEIIYDVCGGVPNDKKIKAVIPGGSSMPPLRGDQIDVQMNEEELKKIGTHIGTGGIIVIDEDTDLVATLLRIAHFYHHESCGQCTPCREGCGWMEKILKRMNAGNGSIKDLDLLVDISNNIEGNTVCALGEAAAWAIRGFVTTFRDEFEAKVSEKVTFVAPNVAHGKKQTQESLLVEI